MSSAYEFGGGFRPKPRQKMLDILKDTRWGRIVRGVGQDIANLPGQAIAFPGAVAGMAKEMFLDRPKRMITELDQSRKEGRAPDPSLYGDSMMTAFDLGGAGMAAASVRKGSSAGMFGGRLSKTADLKKLEVAKKMRKFGVSPERVRLETGWEKAKGGHWNYEFSDAPSRIIEDEFNMPLEGATLRDVFDHPELYKAYPWLESMPFKRNTEGHSFYHPRTGTTQEHISIGHGNANDRNTLLHEIQHAIQDREMWPQGGSYDESLSALTGGAPQAYVDHLKKLRDKAQGEYDALYKNITAQGGLDALGPAASRKAMMDSKAIRERISSAENGLRSMAQNDRYGIYHRLEGEHQARLVEARSHLTADQLRERPPSMDYDIPEDELITRSGYGASWSKGKGKTPKEEMARKILGAPKSITTARGEAAARKRYMKDMEEGAPARHWYDDAGQANLFHAGDDPVLAAKLTAAQARTSASTPVDANLGHAIRAHNQKMVGDPAKAGLFPNAMGEAIDRYYALDNPADVFEALGPKIGPYAMNIAEGGGYGGYARQPAMMGHNGGPPLEAPAVKPRAVHDIWDARAWGYTNPDGSTFSRAVSPTQHRWMDNQMDRVIEASNNSNLGGVADWDHRSGQAAAWIAKKARAEGKTIAEAGKSYSEYWPKYYAQGSYESVPGRTTNHLPGLRAKGEEAAREAHMRQVARIMTDDQKRDIIGKAFGGLTGESFPGPGLFEGKINPGMQSQIAVGRATGGKTIDPASASLMDRIEASRAWALGQDAAGWHAKGNPGEAIKRTDLLEFGTGGTVDPDTFRRAVANMRDKIGEKAAGNIGVIPTKRGFNLANFNDPKALPPQAFVDMGKGMGKVLGMDAPTRYGMIGNNLIKNDWGKNQFGQQYLKLIDRPEFKEAFDKSIPDIARQLYALDEDLAGMFGGQGVSQIQKLRKIVANEGYDGLMAAIRKGALSVGAVGLLLEVTGPDGSGGGA